jgi:hypothetical protein
MSFIIAGHRALPAKIQQRYPDALILDVTSAGPEPWIRFSPFYPHGGIPVPFSPGQFSTSVEGIWQGLKVFEHSDVDPSKFLITQMKGLKRSARTFGQVLGHRAGVSSDRLLSYVEARYAIYLPSYRWVLEHRLETLLEELRRLQASQTIVLLDYETTTNLEDVTRPLSHAGLIQRYLQGQWPTPSFSS